MPRAKIKKKLRITLMRSAKGSKPDQRATVAALGLRKIRQMVTQPNTPAVRGMVKKVIHLLQVEEADD